MRTQSTSTLGLLAGAVIVSILIRIIKSTRDAQEGPDERRRPVLPDRDDPRWGPESGRGQIAGKSCAACNERITLALEGMACEICRLPCHQKCVARHVASHHKPGEDGTPYR